MHGNWVVPSPKQPLLPLPCSSNAGPQFPESWPQVWSGFFTSHAELKIKTRATGRDLRAAQQLEALHQDAVHLLQRRFQWREYPRADVEDPTILRARTARLAETVGQDPRRPLRQWPLQSMGKIYFVFVFCIFPDFGSKCAEIIVFERKIIRKIRPFQNWILKVQLLRGPSLGPRPHSGK